LIAAEEVAAFFKFEIGNGPPPAAMAPSCGLWDKLLVIVLLKASKEVVPGGESFETMESGLVPSRSY
jgi:hypothetical protein